MKRYGLFLTSKVDGIECILFDFVLNCYFLETASTKALILPEARFQPAVSVELSGSSAAIGKFAKLTSVGSGLRRFLVYKSHTVNLMSIAFRIKVR